MTSLRLFMLSPTVIFRARVDEASATYPLDDFDYDTVTIGAAGSIFPGMTIRLGSAVGLDDYGRQRIRRVASSSNLRVGRSSRGTHDGELTVVDNAYIDILDDFRIWSKIPFIDTGAGNKVYKDSDLPGDTGWVEFPPPVANGGVGFAGTIDAGTGLVTVEFDATNSFQFDPALSSALSVPPDFLWEVVDGTITVGTATDAEITATFPAGFRWVHLTVTSDDGILHQCHIPVFARDPANDETIEHKVVSHRMTPSGQEIQFRILQDLPRSDYPEGTLCMLWDDDLQVSDPFRVHMLFIGWEQSNQAGVVAQRSANLRDTVITCVDTAGRLKTLPGFSQIMNAGVPSDWEYTQYPNMFYYFWFVLYWHSTALELSDLLLGTQNLNNFDFYKLSSDEGTLFEQVESLAAAVTPDHHLTCSRRNDLMLVVDPIVQHVADRDSSVMDALDESDWVEVRLGRTRPPRVFELITWAIESSDSAADVLRSRAPGDSPGQGYQRIETTSERIAVSQSSLNNVEGNRYARLNAPYGHFTISAPYDRLAAGHDPAKMAWMNLTISAANAPQREGAFSNVRGIVHEVNIQYDYRRTGLVRTAQIVWEMETSGPAAITYPLP